MSLLNVIFNAIKSPLCDHYWEKVESTLDDKKDAQDLGYLREWEYHVWRYRTCGCRQIHTWAWKPYNKEIKPEG